uniref:Uncharacterized protein n=1 Tax=Sipha flava TaxID=143950 RepID=A0A2S2QK19_9HEMI
MAKGQICVEERTHEHHARRQWPYGIAKWRFFAGRARAPRPTRPDARALVRIRSETVFVGATVDSATVYACGARAVFNQYSTRARLRETYLFNIMYYDIHENPSVVFLSIILHLCVATLSREREHAFSPRTKFPF